jgi:hypothetical protein
VPIQRPGCQPGARTNRQCIDLPVARNRGELGDWMSATAHTSTKRQSDTSFGPVEQIDAGLLNCRSRSRSWTRSRSKVRSWRAFWGARTADIVAALWPERCQGLVSVSGYLRARHSRPRPRRARAASDSCGSRSRLVGVVASNGSPKRRRSACRRSRSRATPTAPPPEPSAYAGKFSGKYIHRTIEGGIGHNLPQEAPEAFAQAVIDVYGDAI